jgi:hypothetical protein
MLVANGVLILEDRDCRVAGILEHRSGADVDEAPPAALPRLIEQAATLPTFDLTAPSGSARATLSLGTAAVWMTP